MTLRQLQYLHALAREGSFAAAARRCHVSQPSLSEQIGKLEAHLGELVVRGARSVTLTPLGEQVSSRAAALLRGVGEIERLASNPGIIRVGMIDTVAPYLMPDLMSRRPEQVIPVQARTSELIEMLEEGRIEAAVLAGGTLPPGMPALQVGSEDLRLLVSADDEEFDHEGEDPGVLLDAAADYEMLLLADGHCLRDQVTDVCRANRGAFSPFQAATMEMLTEMVARHIGVTLIPQISVVQIGRHPGVRVRRLLNPPVRTLHLVTLRTPTPTLLSLGDTLSSILAERTAAIS